MNYNNPFYKFFLYPIMWILGGILLFIDLKYLENLGIDIYIVFISYILFLKYLLFVFFIKTCIDEIFINQKNNELQ